MYKRQSLTPKVKKARKTPNSLNQDSELNYEALHSQKVDKKVKSAIIRHFLRDIDTFLESAKAGAPIDVELDTPESAPTSGGQQSPKYSPYADRYDVSECYKQPAYAFRQ